MLVDTHAHLDFPEFAEDVSGVLERAAAAGVEEVVTIGIDSETSRKAIEIADRFPNVWATVGLHPHGARRLDARELNLMRVMSRNPKVVAIGEIGLDYYRDRQPRDVQKECLRQQLEQALELRLPVVFHIRDAHDDFMKIAGEYAPRLPASILHCFSGDWNVASQCLDWGWYLSVPGIVTFAKAEVLQDVVIKSPLDHLLLETDAPFLAPVPYRGKPNEPAYLYHTAKRVAELRHEDFETVAQVTTENAHAVFNLS